MDQERTQDYQNRLAGAEKRVSEIRGKINSVITLRILVFLAAGFGVYLFLETPWVSFGSGLTGLIIFGLLVKRHGNLSLSRKYQESIATLNQLELDAFQGNFEELDTGKEFLDPEHDYSYDIDLFGKGSFFQFFNRTKTFGGKRKLAQLLALNSCDRLNEKQEATQEISSKTDWRQHFIATADIIEEMKETEPVTTWLKEHKPYLKSVVIQILRFIYPVASLASFILLSMDLISYHLVVGLFFGGLIVTGMFIKKTTAVYQVASKNSEIINQYAKLLQAIETEKFDSVIMKAHLESIRTDKKSAAAILNELGKIMNQLHSRNNLLIGIFGNAWGLWDLQYVSKLEKWISMYKNQAEQWFETIHEVDALISTGNFASNYPGYCYPSLNSDDNVIKATSAGHPLIPAVKRINNDILISKNNFVIVTGANMAGKSTFLRTIALNIVMANAGMPVCATDFEYSPIKLITSMRTSDSLQKEESYFFSELKRLKFIIDKIQTDKYFIILDEILKGTNSKDKEQGSKKFVKKLVASGSTGIIATHDLALCQISEDFSSVINHYFDAEIIEGELHFDYKMKDGVCQNMNASFLLKKMGIVDD